MKKIAIIQAQEISKQLKEDAQSLGLPLSDSTDLYKLAVGAIRDSFDLSRLGGGLTLDDLVLGVIQKLVVKAPVRPLENYTKKYLWDTLLPNIVVQMKDSGLNLKQIEGDSNVQKVLKHFGFDPDVIELFYTGEKPPFKTLKNEIDLDEMLSSKPRANIFSKFKGESESQFIKFWTSSVVNSARNFIRDYKDVAVDKAKSFGNYDEEDDRNDAVSESHHSPQKDDEVSVEDKISQKQLLKKLQKVDDRFVLLFNILKESGGVEQVQKQLNLDSYNAKKLLKSFYANLKREVDSQGWDQKDTLRVLQARRVQNSIIRRFLNVSLL